MDSLFPYGFPFRLVERKTEQIVTKPIQSSSFLDFQIIFSTRMLLAVAFSATGMKIVLEGSVGKDTRMLHQEGPYDRNCRKLAVRSPELSSV
jgi:hypothetical protein